MKPKTKIFSTLTALVLALSLCLGLAACGNTPASPGDTQTPSDNSADQQKDAFKTIVLAEGWPFSSLYPVVTPESTSDFGIAYWTMNFYDTLVRYDKNNEIVGCLAETWDVSDDGRTYTFHLRDGIQFSDGTPLTADAVKQSIDAARVNLGSFVGNYGKIGILIEKTEAVDESTFVLTLSNPYYSALNDLTICLAYAVVNPKAFEGGADQALQNCSDKTMGTGPYMFESYSNKTYTFVRNPYYWGDAPDVDCFKVKEIPDNDAKILALQSGEVTAILGQEKLTHDGFAQLSAAGFGTKVDTDGNRTIYLGMRIADTNIWNETYTEVVQTVPAGVFADINVRLAAAYTIDQQLLAETVFNGIQAPAETWFSATKPFCDTTVTVYETNAKKAEQLLTEAGWIDSDGDGVREKDGAPLSVTIAYPDYLGTISSAMIAIKSQLEEVGFSVELAPAADMMGWYMAGMTGSYDLIYWKTNGGTMDPASTISNIGTMADPVLGQFTGFGGITNELITELDTTSSSERVKEIYDAILKNVADEALLIPLVYENEMAAWNSDVIADYTYYYDPGYILVQNIRLK